VTYGSVLPGVAVFFIPTNVKLLVISHLNDNPSQIQNKGITMITSMLNSPWLRQVRIMAKNINPDSLLYKGMKKDKNAR